MRLNKLIINGFKSFCNKTEFIFPKNITGIVGPNGSGKSNIADAVRWVLGEQNPRLLRGGKMEDIIFNGTQKKKALNFCEVSLIFDNEDKSLHTDYLEIMVTRRVYRNGDSEYEINNTPCRLKDVIELFSDTGIGKEGYSIIGQGKIDDILSRKTEDRRAVFEEAAGINYFKLKKHESELKLNRAEENLLRINDIASEQERMLEPLKLQAENAKKYITLSQELKELSSALFIVDYDRLTAKERTIASNIDNVSSEISTLEQDVDKINNEIQLEQDNYQELETDASGIAESVIVASRKFSEIENKNNKAHFELEKNESDISRINTELKEIVQKKELLLSSNESNSVLIEQLKSKLNKSAANLENFKLTLEEQLHNLNTIKNSLDKAKNDLINNMNTLSQSESSRSRYLAIKEQMQARVTELETSLNKLREANIVFKSKHEENQKNYSLEQIKKNELQSSLNNTNNKLEQTILSIRSLRINLDEINKNININTSRLKTIEDMASSYEGYAPTVKYAMQSAKKRNMHSVYGTLASIIDVPKEYETAIDMVLGGALQNIVCDDEQSAKILIEDLRKNSQGRATFLPISSVKPSYISSSELKDIDRSNYINIASKLISFDTKFQGIIDNLLGRTLVIKSIDDGISIRKSNSKLKMVSLIGDVMHSGGSITGGSVRSTSSSLLSRKRVLNELKRNVALNKEKLHNTNAELSKLIESRSLLEEQKRKDEILLHEQDIKLTQLNEILKSSKDDILESQNKETELNDGIISLNQSIEDINTSLNTVSGEKAGIESENIKLEKQIESLQSDYTKKENTYGLMQEELLTIQLNHSNIDHELQSLVKEDQNRQALICEYSQKQISLNSQLEDIGNAKASLTNELNNLKSELDSAQIHIDQLKSSQKSIEERRTNCNKKIRNLQECERNTSKAHLNALDKLHRLEIQLSNTQAQKKSLSDNLWTRFELTYAGAEIYRPQLGFDTNKAGTKVKQINAEISSLGTVNVNAVSEYTELKERHSELVTQRDDLLKSIDDLNKLINIMLNNMEKQFVDSFSLLKEYFAETFSKLFGGGIGELKLSNPDKALECGIEIIVQPPGKKKQILSLFSGGERALTAIALIFAMLKLRPSPFCIFDEIEAALDDANINYFADYLKCFSDNTQFIVVTHRKGTMERCDSLYGIAMPEKGISNVLSIDISKYE